MEQRHNEALESIVESERRVLHSQKMAALGQLAERVAHSFANGITVVASNAQMARDAADATSPVLPLLDSVVEAADRLGRLSGDLLAFSTPASPLASRRMDLGKIVSGMERMLAAQRHHRGARRARPRRRVPHLPARRGMRS